MSNQNSRKTFCSINQY